MRYVEVLDVAELPTNQTAKVELDGKEVLIANLDGEFYAISNKCSHLGGSLVKGGLEGNLVTCPRHGARFDVKTGKAVREAKIAIIKMGVKDLESYPVMVEGQKVLLGLPE